MLLKQTGQQRSEYFVDVGLIHLLLNENAVKDIRKYDRKFFKYFWMPKLFFPYYHP